MRPGMFDESKIIKKENKSITNEKINETENIAYINQDAIAKLDLNNSESSDNTIINNDSEKSTIVKKQPVFVFERDKITNEIKTVNTVKSTFVNFDIPGDQLKYIYINTIKRINEINIDLEILNSLISNNDEDYSFYYSQREILLKELKFCNLKKETLEKFIN